jgi:hypothetical protein
MRAEAPLFSVLLPTHNRSEVLRLAIDSVLAQSEPDFELLIVADGCTDDTGEVVASFEDPRIHFFDLPKAPHFGYANRNVALREARGRLIAFAAHDDLWLHDHLAVMGDLLARTGAAWAYSRPLWVSTDGIIVPFGTNLQLADELQAFMQCANTIPAPCAVYARSMLEEVGYWPEDVEAAGDWMLWRRMLSRADVDPAYSPAPTNLHFSANWKKSRFSLLGEVQTLLAIADDAPWWPPILRHTVTDPTEQATIWRAMQAGGPQWSADLRAAVDTVINRIAWTAVRETLPHIAQATAAVSNAEAALAAVRASTSWRVTAPLRALKRLLRKS